MKRSIFFTILILTVLSGLRSQVTQSLSGYEYEHTYEYYDSYVETDLSEFVFSYDLDNDDFNYSECSFFVNTQATIDVAFHGVPDFDDAVYWYCDIVITEKGGHDAAIDYFYHETFDLVRDPGSNTLTGSCGVIENMPDNDYSFNMALSYTDVDNLDIDFMHNVICIGGKDQRYDQVCMNDYGDTIVLIGGSNTGIEHPVLIVEGFDPLNKKCTGAYLSLLGPAGSTFCDKDMWFMNFHDGGRNLNDNSLSVLGAIQHLGREYSVLGPSYGLKVIGLSMGGVLSRYALAFAEHHGIQHYCSQFFSYDSPQRGACINHYYQQTIHEMFNDIDDRPQSPEDARNSLNSTAAQQLLRDNAISNSQYSTPIYRYVYGTNPFLEFYSQLNIEENELITPPTQYGLYNSDTEKPGYPYSQNHISCLAISNGKLVSSGNTEGEAHLWNPDWVMGSATIYPELYDTQPGSTLELLESDYPGHACYFGIISTHVGPPEYDPVFIPLRSALCLRTEPDTNSEWTTDEQFAIDHFDDIVIPTAASSATEYLSCFTYFDDVSIRPNTRYLHEYFSHSVASQINTWLEDPDLNDVTYLQGTINTNAHPGISLDITVYCNGQPLSTSPVVNENGVLSFQVTVPFIQDIEVDFKVFDGKIPVPGTYSVPYASNDNTVILDGALDVNLSACLSPDMIVVSNDPADSVWAFSSVPAALDWVEEYTTWDDITINIAAGTFDPFELRWLSDMTVRIEGSSAETTIISGSVPSQAAIYCHSNSNCTLSLERLTVENSAFGGIRIVNDDPEYLCQYTLKDIVVRDNQIHQNTVLPFGSAGITLQGSGVISGCTITDNHSHGSVGTGYPSIGLGFGGGVYIDNNDTQPVVLESCTIAENSAWDGGGVYCTGTGPIRIQHNRIRNNQLMPVPPDVYQHDEAVGLLAEECPDLILRANIVDQHMAIEDATVHYGRAAVIIRDSDDCSIHNNTFANNSDPNDSDCSLYGIRLNCADNADVQNCLFLNNKASYYLHCSNNSTIDYYCESGNEEDNSYNFCSAPVGFHIYIYESTPHLTGSTDPNPYTPIWNDQIRSPLIDAGNPNMNGTNWFKEGGIKDPDGSCPDIGAKTVSHQQDHKRIQWKTYNWISFPVTDRWAQGNGTPADEDYLPNYDTAWEMMGPIRSEEILDELKWVVNEYDYYMEYNDQVPTSWNPWTNGDHIIDGRQGYKLLLHEDVEEDKFLNPIGQVTPEYALITLTPNEPEYDPDASDAENHYNWVGYFLPESMTPWDAFEPVLDEITEIKAKNWTSVKNPDGTWTHGGNDGSGNPRDPEYAMPDDWTINYGDMVMVHYPDNAGGNAPNLVFTLGGDEVNPVEPKVQEQPQSFLYDEQSNYIPVMVEMEDESGTREAEPIEIGILVNGECKGASVIDGPVVMIPTYIIGEDTNFDEAEVTFVLHYEGDRSDGKLVRDYAVKTKQREEYIASNLNFGDGHYLHWVSLRDDDQQVPPVYATALEQNYPNPFNPETKIRYSIAEDGAVKIDIFNIKGQRVHRLVQADQTAGNHEIVWYGRDDNDRKVSSGIYFYRMQANGKTLQRKMLLLK